MLQPAIDSMPFLYSPVNSSRLLIRTFCRAEVLAEQNLVLPWWLALWLIGGPHESPMVGSMRRDGVDTGHVFIGRIREPAAVAAALALRFSAQSFVPKTA